MEKIIKRIVCFLKRNHTTENLKKKGGKFHEFYGMNGGGRACTCQYCGKSVIVSGR